MSPPDSVRSACALVLGWLAVRDLSAAEIRLRLRRRQCPTDLAERAIAHLRESRAIDDERVAVSRARVESALRGRGRERVLLKLQSIGIDAETARRAVATVFQDVDEEALLERAVTRRLKAAGGVVRNPSAYRRLHSALIRQGFAPADVRRVLDRRRAKWPENGEPQD
jgi:SOS response regulatory protein OraA/RecX